MKINIIIKTPQLFDANQTMSTTCVVFVSDQAYFNRFLETCNQLITNGKYVGDICLIIGDDLNEIAQHNQFIINNRIIVKYFPNILFPDSFMNVAKTMKREEHWVNKLFQYHKFHVFNTFFKRWNYIFYIDCGMTILSDISPIIECRLINKMVAHSDGFPWFDRKLKDNFDMTTYPEISQRLSSKHDLICDYFQTTIMLFDTSIITHATFSNLIDLAITYPISITNDQGIIALYYCVIEPCFVQIRTRNNETCYYDYNRRNRESKYIMLKSYY
jgi:hypothetical protein